MSTAFALRASPIRFAIVLAGALLFPALSGPSVAAEGGEMVFAVTHAATGTTLATAGSDGHRLGDLRVVSLPTTDESGAPGRLDSVLITTGIDTPGPGDEVRIGQLVFSFGDGTDQLFVAGSATYPAEGATIAVSATAIRPVLGGSGKYQGASGWCETEHLADDSWKHTFHLDAPP